MATKKTAAKRKTPAKNNIFNEIVSGLDDAVRIAKGEADPSTYRVHVPEEIDVRAVRKSTGLTQDAFACVYGFSTATVRDYEQRRRTPDRATRAYLIIIEQKPDEVRSILATALAMPEKASHAH